MKIILTNVKCYEHASFDFGSTGISLLSGQSGKGKSSIFQGLNFALFGSGGSKIVRHGASSCKVEVEFDDMIIVRTKNPSKLVVNNVHEDEEGQQIIYARFGKTFDVTGYIPQNAGKTFVLMSPVDKLAFIETFAFTTVDLPSLKARCREEIREKQDALTATAAKIEMVKIIETNMLTSSKSSCVEDHILSLSASSTPETMIAVQSTLKLLDRNRVDEENYMSVMKGLRQTMEDRKTDLSIHFSEMNVSNEIMLNAEVIISKIGSNLTYVNELSKELIAAGGELKVSGGCNGVEKDENENEKLKEDNDRLEERSIREQLKLLTFGREEKIASEKLIFAKDFLSNALLDEVACAKEKINVCRDELASLDPVTEVDCIDCESVVADAEQLIHLRTKLYYSSTGSGSREEFELSTISSFEDCKRFLNMTQVKLDSYGVRVGRHTCPSCKAPIWMNGKGELCQEQNIENKDQSGNSTEDDRKATQSKLKWLIRDSSVWKDIETILGCYETELPDITLLREDARATRAVFCQFQKLTRQMEFLNKAVTSPLSSRTIQACEYKVREAQAALKAVQVVTHVVTKPLASTVHLSENELRDRLEYLTNLKVVRATRANHKREIIDKIERYVLKNRQLSKDIRRLDGKGVGIEPLDSEEVTTIYDERVGKDYLERIRSKLSQLSNTIGCCEYEIVELESCLSAASLWHVVDEQRREIMKITQQTEELCRVETKEKNELIAVLKVRDSILESESIAIANIVSTINSYARVYLDEFFEDGPISVRMTTFKKVKSVSKPQIGMDIQYKGMDCDLQMLSGGEVSRIVLAYTLSLAEMFNCPLLLLDECTSSLDQETADHVFETIGSHFPGKLTVIIAHQVVTGTFDKTIELP